MRKVTKLLAALTILASIFIELPAAAYAHQSALEHNKELEAVLFEDGYSKRQSDKIKNSVMALEYASQLTIDQFGGKNESEFTTLKSLGMGGLPRNFSSIDYSKDLIEGIKGINANTHRRYTHQGWERDYSSVGKNVQDFWTRRRNVLLGTVNSIFNFRSINLFGYDEKCESLAGIIYYVHILGDYDEADKFTKISLLTNLAGNANAEAQDKNYDMITSLKKYVQILFSDQTSSSDYKDLMNGMDQIEKGAGPIFNSTGGVNTEAEFQKVHQYADDLLALLEEHVPRLLKNEDFFANVFYPELAAAA